jgi:polyferredoxin
MVKIRRRFWIETVLGIMTLLASLLTAVWPQWIEALFGANPDGGSGSLEWSIVVVSFAATVTLGLMARAEWCRALVT